MNPRLPIVLLESARHGLKEIIQNIRKHSPQNAALVKEAVLERIGKLSLFPRKFAVNPFLRAEDKEYRSTTVKNVLIVYRVEESRIVVVSILYGRSNPDEFLHS